MLLILINKIEKVIKNERDVILFERRILLCPLKFMIIFEDY